jgi:GAF domain-containing protein
MGHEAPVSSWSESERIAALKSFDILDTPPEPDFDDVVRLVAQICEAPRAAINLIDENRQWFTSVTGAHLTAGPWEQTFCAHAVQQRTVFVVPDALQSSRRPR